MSTSVPIRGGARGARPGWPDAWRRALSALPEPWSRWTPRNWPRPARLPQGRAEADLPAASRPGGQSGGAEIPCSRRSALRRSAISIALSAQTKFVASVPGSPGSVSVAGVISEVNHLVTPAARAFASPEVSWMTTGHGWSGPRGRGASRGLRAAPIAAPPSDAGRCPRPSASGTDRPPVALRPGRRRCRPRIPA